MAEHRHHTIIATCCRDWPIAIGYKVGSCGLCGEVPTYTGPDESCRCDWCV